MVALVYNDHGGGGDSFNLVTLGICVRPGQCTSGERWGGQYSPWQGCVGRSMSDGVGCKQSGGDGVCGGA